MEMEDGVKLRHIDRIPVRPIVAAGIHFFKGFSI